MDDKPRWALGVAAVASVVAAATFVAGLAAGYMYYQRGVCPSLLGWWDVSPWRFRASIAASSVAVAALLVGTARFRGAAWFLAALSIGAWFWFGSVSAAERTRLQTAFRFEQGEVVRVYQDGSREATGFNSPIEPAMLSTDSSRCNQGG